MLVMTLVIPVLDQPPGKRAVTPAASIVTNAPGTPM